MSTFISSGLILTRIQYSVLMIDSERIPPRNDHLFLKLTLLLLGFRVEKN